MIHINLTAPVTIENSDRISYINGNIGSKIEITCNARGKPKPSYMWLKDKVPVSDIEDSTYEELQNGLKTFYFDTIISTISNFKRSFLQKINFRKNQ